MKIKEKYLIMAVIIGVCTGDISGNCVWAADASQQTEKIQTAMIHRNLEIPKRNRHIRNF